MQDSNDKYYGYLEFPTDQSIVCASGDLKNKNQNSIDKGLAFFISSSTGPQKIKNFLKTSTLDLPIKNKSFISITDNALKNRSKLYKSSRAPPLLYS